MGEDGFRGLVGLQLTREADGRARAVLEAGDPHLNRHGTVHGGVIATVADSVMGEAVSTTDDDARPVTIEMKVTYLEPGAAGRIEAVGQVRRRGKRITIVEAEVTQDGEPLALALGTFATV